MIKLTEKQKKWVINQLEWEVEQPGSVTFLLENEGVIIMPWEIMGTSCNASYPYSLGVKCNKDYYELECITFGFLRELIMEGNL